MSFTQFLCVSNAHQVTHSSMRWLAHPRTSQEENSMIASCKRSSSISRSLCYRNLFLSQEKTVISPVPYGDNMLHFEYSWIRISCIYSKWRWWKIVRCFQSTRPRTYTTEEASWTYGTQPANMRTLNDHSTRMSLIGYSAQFKVCIQPKI